MPLHEMGKDANYFSVLDLKDKFSDKHAKITEEPVEVRAIFLGSERPPFRKINMPKSINH